ncbi:hypothetical protein EB232_07650 [Mesorhizobium sp. NZP2077]|nr:hypothetical protein EB232_07650 [Mesorhizobium sp. NZP2077]
MSAREWLGQQRPIGTCSPERRIEETIVNLATVLGFNTIERQTIRDATEMYRVGDMPFQRGANAILDLSRLLLGRQPPAG